MNDAQLIKRLAGTDAYAAGGPLPDEIWTLDVALQEIERRTGMQTQKRTEVQVARPPEKRGRRLRAAVAAFVAIVAIGGAAAIWASLQSESDVGSRVGEALNEARVTGDVELFRQLYSDEATFTDLADSRSVSLQAVLRDPLQPGVDWDGDGTTTVLDSFIGLAMEDYAVGVILAHSCSQSDSTTIVCDEVLQGHPFVSNPNGYRISSTYTLVDGLITEQVFDASPWGTGQWFDTKMDPARVWPYQQWVQANHPELEAELFSDFAFLRMTPSTVENHRQLIAEWRASG
jgi:hypothetical protein